MQASGHVVILTGEPDVGGNSSHEIIEFTLLCISDIFLYKDDVDKFGHTTQLKSVEVRDSLLVC